MDIKTPRQQQVGWLTASGRHPIDTVVLLNGASEPEATELLALSKFLGRSSLQRTLYHLAQAGIKTCMLVYQQSEFAQAVKSQVGEIDLGSMTVCSIEPGQSSLPNHALTECPVVARAEFVFDKRIIEKVVGHNAPVKLISRHGDELGIARVDRRYALSLIEGEEFHTSIASITALEDLSTESIPTYVPSMRRSFPPYWQQLRQERDLEVAADKVMDSAQKGVLDFPARYLHPAPENWLARLAAGTQVTPNQITIISAIVAFIGTYWFATQQYAAALVVAVLAGILDGVDGKPARVKLLSSPFGDRLDHTLDVSFEFSWYLAIGWGLYQSTGNWALFGYGFFIIIIMLIARALSGLYLLQTGHQIHDHTVFDRTVRLFAGRRNIYVLLLVIGYLTDHFLASFYLVIIWGIVTVAIYALRNIMVLIGRVLPV